MFNENYILKAKVYSIFVELYLHKQMDIVT